VNPRIYFPPGTSDEEREAVTREVRSPWCPTRRVDVRVTELREVGYHRHRVECDKCHGCVWFVWRPVVDGINANDLMEDAAEVAFPCPLCHPDPSEVVQALAGTPDTMAMLRAIAERFPEHVIAAADEARSKHGEPDVKAWRHPEDVEAIEAAFVAVWPLGESAERTAKARAALGDRIGEARRIKLVSVMRADAERAKAGHG
jgi:hypothetical protein